MKLLRNSRNKSRWKISLFIIRSLDFWLRVVFLTFGVSTIKFPIIFDLVLNNLANVEGVSLLVSFKTSSVFRVLSHSRTNSTRKREGTNEYQDRRRTCNQKYSFEGNAAEVFILSSLGDPRSCSITVRPICKSKHLATFLSQGDKNSIHPHPHHSDFPKAYYYILLSHPIQVLLFFFHILSVCLQY